jgi:DNA topoisomerase II
MSLKLKLKPENINDKTETESKFLDKTITEVFQKHTQHQRILLNPDMYTGSKTMEKNNMYIYDSSDDKDRIEKRMIEFIPAFYKIFDEALVNACDHFKRIEMTILKQEKIKKGELPPDPLIDITYTYNVVKNIYVNVDIETGIISIKNDGEGIPVIIHEKEKIYVPELIFGNLNSGTNYNENIERTWGGVNGLGIKLCNIMSTEFKIETIDAYRSLHYEQQFRNNMYTIEPPIIKKSKNKPFTKVTFKPDFKYFKIDGITDDMYNLIKKRTYDIAGTTTNLNVYFNDVKIPIKNFEKFVDLYIGSKSEQKRHYLKINNDWEIVVTNSQSDNFEQVSYVNNICSYDGGKHVNYIQNLLATMIKEYAENNKKGYKDILLNSIKDQLFIFLNYTCVNPEFKSQTKDLLKNEIKNKCDKDIPEEFIKKLCMTDMKILDNALEISNFKQHKSISKSLVCTAKNKHVDVPKLSDATYAGTDKSKHCILILTEGDSAATLAKYCISGFESEEKARYYGVLPLRGKIFNPKGTSYKDYSQKEIIQHIAMAIGLEIKNRGKEIDYTIPSNFAKLRYGKIYIMADADTDGNHIKGLVFNLFHDLFPSILKIKDFISSPLTPIKTAVYKGKLVKHFYTETEYKLWSKSPNIPKYDSIEYKKGLGSSTKEEGKSYFKNLNLQEYSFDDDKDNSSIVKAFGKKNAGDRKSWITDYLECQSQSASVSQKESRSGSPCPIQNMNGSQSENMNQSQSQSLTLKLKINNKKDTEASCSYTKTSKTSITEFIDDSLVEFSAYNCQRNIPNIIDGFKPGQRKIMEYILYRYKKAQKLKVSQLSGFVSAEMSYLHAEDSLSNTIVALAQDFVGSNNINLLFPDGQFGSREANGDDFASTRYIHTYVCKYSKSIFNDDDRILCDYLLDNGNKIEPLYFYPVLPMVLINGSRGIGTGWSSEVPCYNPIDIIDNIERYNRGDPFIEMIPWYRNYRGKVTKISDNSYEIKGSYFRKSPTEMVIDELPVGSKLSPSYMTYKEYITSMREDIVQKNMKLNKDNKKWKQPEVILKDFEILILNDNIKCTLTFRSEDELNTLLLDTNKFEKIFQLNNKISTTNMFLFNYKNVITKYNSTSEILREFCDLRKEKYVERKIYLLEKLQREMDIYSEKIRFIEYVNDPDHEIKPRNTSKNELNELLKKYNFKYIPAPRKFKYVNPNNDLINDDDNEDITEEIQNYNYLINIPVVNLTTDELEKLRNKYISIKSEYDKIDSVSENMMWINDINDIKKNLNYDFTPKVVLKLKLNSF